MELTKDQILLLGNLAFVGNNHGMVKASRSVFMGLEAYKPDNPWIKLGLATSLLQADQSEEARAILENDVLPKQPDNAIAKVYLALAYRSMSKKDRARELFQEVLDQKDADENAVNFSKIMVQILASAKSE